MPKNEMVIPVRVEVTIDTPNARLSPEARTRVEKHAAALILLRDNLVAAHFVGDIVNQAVLQYQRYLFENPI